MKTSITLLASLAITGFAMAAVAPTYSVDSRADRQIRLGEGDRGIDFSGVVASKVCDGMWLFYTGNSSIILAFESHESLFRGDQLHCWGEQVGTEEYLGEVMPIISVQGFEVK